MRSRYLERSCDSCTSQVDCHRHHHFAGVSPFYFTRGSLSMEKQDPSDDNSVDGRFVQLSWDSQLSKIDDAEKTTFDCHDELCQEASNGVHDAVTAASPIGTEFESKFQKLLEDLSGWQGVQLKTSDSSAISGLLSECENIVKSKATIVQQTDVDNEHRLIQKASQILHDLVCLHTPGNLISADLA